MKKLIFMAFITASVVMSADVYGATIMSTFYGTKCGDSSINPCKGETTRICAVVEMTIEHDSIKNTNHVIEIIKDEKGSVKAIKEYFTDNVPAQLKRVNQISNRAMPSIPSIPSIPSMPSIPQIKGTPDRVTVE